MPIILKAGVPLIKVSLANIVLQFGQVQGTKVKSLVIRCLKHLISDPLPPLRYLNNCVLHPLQYISTELSGTFLFGLAICFQLLISVVKLNRMVIIAAFIWVVLM